MVLYAMLGGGDTGESARCLLCALHVESERAIWRSSLMLELLLWYSVIGGVGAAGCDPLVTMIKGTGLDANTFVGRSLLGDGDLWELCLADVVVG